MLTVEQYEYIRIAHRIYGKKIKEIARDTGHSKNTVKKALRGEYRGYNVRMRQAYPVLGPYISIIDSWLRADKERPKKQRHTAKRVYDRLCYEHGFEGSSRTVRRYVHDARRRLGLNADQVFIPLDPQLGVEGEVDWGTCQAVLAGEQVKLKMFCIRSKGSGKHLVQCFPCERQQALFEGHIRGFSFFHGIFPVLIYDNLTTAVEKVLRGKDRKLQESFTKFQAYYNFTPRFCNPGQGHEKGGVEGLVGYARRNYMVPVPEADSLEDLNRCLWDQCMAYGGYRMAGRDKTVNELYEEEKERLLALPHIPFSNIESYSCKVDKYSTVIIDKNHYSVPTRYAGLKVQGIVYVDRVEIFQGSQKIACHGRVYGNNKWQLDPFHYLELISRRPLAFGAARPILQWRQHWPASLEELLKRFSEKQGSSRGTKDFIKVLLLFKEHDEGRVIEAVEKAVSAQVSTSDAVEHILLNPRDSRGICFGPVESWPRLSPPDLSVYSRIGGEL
jgi:transposase